MSELHLIYDGRDFLPWAKEKSAYLINNLCCALKNKPELIDDNDFLSALEYALKLFTLFSARLDNSLCELSKELLVKYNVDGFQYLNDILDGTKNSGIMIAATSSFVSDDIMTLILENSKTNRTVIAAILARRQGKTLWEQRIADDLEQVHTGEHTWEWFYNLHVNDKQNEHLFFTDPLCEEIYRSIAH